MNTLDLGIFNSIQSAKHRTQTRNVGELVAVVLEAFEKLEAETIDDTFHTLFHVLECVILNDGHNNFKMPRQCKSVKRRRGTLSRCRSMTYELVEKVKCHADYADNTDEDDTTDEEDDEDLMERLRSHFDVYPMMNTSLAPLMVFV